MWNNPHLDQKNGEVLTESCILTVGSLICSGGNASGLSRAATVSPICGLEIPAMATISPNWASVTLLRLSPENTNRPSILAERCLSGPSITITGWPWRIVPRATRPIANAPMYSSASSEVICNCREPSASPVGAGTVSIIVSNNGVSESLSVILSE